MHAVVCPLKSLCYERVNDWRVKFEALGFNVGELTGDTPGDDMSELEVLKKSTIVCSTPEKWDWITRRWREATKRVSLILVDEVHSINAENRGPTLEAIITRMKMGRDNSNKVRFVAISATAPNICDIGEWLTNDGSGVNKVAARVHHFDETYRPVPLEKIVIGYNAGEKHNAFSFDSVLSYKLPGVIEVSFIIFYCLISFIWYILR